MINILEYDDIEFPQDFLWGATTAGQQVEGNNNSFYDDEEICPKTAYGSRSSRYCSSATSRSKASTSASGCCSRCSAAPGNAGTA